VEHEDPVDLTITLPPGGSLDAGELRGHLEDELRLRAEVTAADGTSVTIHAYKRDEVEAVADELVAKLARIGVAEGATVSWVDDNGADVVRPVEV
jgi:hypothetical protein